MCEKRNRKWERLWKVLYGRQRIRNIRKRRSISQEKLASMSGVSYGSVKRFESTGQISLLSLTKIAMALDIADELRNIFSQVPYRDIKEVINETR